MQNQIKYLAILAILISNTCFAFKMTPIEVFMDASGINRTKTVKLTNPGEDQIPLEVKIFERSLTVDGKEIRKPSKDFIVFPTQLILNPKEQRNLRITWNGPKTIDFEKAYRLNVNQIPVNVKKKKNKYKEAETGLNIAFSYMGGIYVRPEKQETQPKLIATKIQRIKNNKVKIRLENQGTEHAVLNNYDVYIISASIKGNKKRERKINHKLIPGENKTMNVLAKSQVDLTYVLPPKTVSGNLQLVFKKIKK